MLIRPELNDTGFSTIGRINHARITPVTLIPMHPHRDDEIITYLRSGKVKHLDSENHTNTISKLRLMVMNAGANFYHEERVLEDGGVLKGLQYSSGRKPPVCFPWFNFINCQKAYSENRWRKIAGKGNDYPLQIRSNTWIMDLRLEEGAEITLPELPSEGLVCLFYVFDGRINVNKTLALVTGESALVENESPVFHAVEATNIVLFITQTNAVHFDGGMYSGNLH